MDKIIITGGSGLVGRHLQDVLPNAIYLSSKDCNLLNIDEIRDLFSKELPNTVVHLAARVGGILDNIKYPVQYLEENIIMNTNLLKVCHEYDVEQVIGILSTCIYPDKVETYPMVEEELFNGPPTPTNFSYGFSKRCMAAHIDSYVKQYGKKWCYLIPCNLYGEYDKFDHHNSHFVSALIRKIHEADKEIELWGTGKPLRQFMYGGDFANIIKFFIENKVVENCNIAPKGVYSINEIATIALQACDKPDYKIKYDSSKPDGQYRKDVSSEKLLNIIGDFKFTSLEEGIRHTYSKVQF